MRRHLLYTGSDIVLKWKGRTLTLEKLQIGICEDDKEERVRLLRLVSDSYSELSVEAFESAEDLLAAFYTETLFFT